MSNITNGDIAEVSESEIVQLPRVDVDHFDVSEILNRASRKLKRRFSGNYVSPTFTKGWKDCPSRALIQNVVVQTKPKSSAATLGTFVHLMYEHMSSRDFLPENNEEMLAVWDLNAKDHHKADYDVLSKEDQEGLLKKALWYVNLYAKMDDYIPDTGYKMKDIWKIKGSEVRSEFFMRVDDFELYQQKLPTLMNLLDRLDIRGDDIYVIDYKTGESNSGDHKLQMMIYSWGVQKLFGIKPTCLIIAPGAPKQIEEITWTKREESVALEEIFNVNDEIKKSIITQNFPRRENRWCQYCPIVESCLGGKPFAEITIDPVKISVK